MRARSNFRRGGVAVAALALLTLPAVSAARAAELRGAPEAPPLPGTGTRAATAAQDTGGTQLVGIFAVTAGSCTDDGTVTGSTFRMIQPGGSADGPFLANSDSSCSDDTYTPLSPGTDGGLSTVGFQPNPDPAFDGSGNALAAAILQPQAFMGVDFAMSTNETDPQSGTAVSVPVVTNQDGTLGGDLRAISVGYNRQHFSQGSPKPDGTRPGATSGPTGTYDEATRAFTLEWTSTIVGGAFNGFTGKWHFEGTFQPSSAPAPAPQPSSPPSSGSPAPAGPSPMRTGAAGGGLASTGGGGPTALALVLLGLAGGGVALRRRATRVVELASVAATAGGPARRP